MENVSRPAKDQQLDTILYEIEMLSFCYERLCRNKWESKRDYFAYVEGFLLHYRNLSRLRRGQSDRRDELFRHRRCSLCTGSEH